MTDVEIDLDGLYQTVCPECRDLLQDAIQMLRLGVKPRLVDLLFCEDDGELIVAHIFARIRQAKEEAG